ncbi:MAG: TonB-dependent receptor [Pseudomonadota bacterium]
MIGALVSSAALADDDEVIDLGTILIQSSSSLTDVDISEDDLERNNPADLQDVFKSEPTISVSSPLPISQKLYVNGIEEVNLSVTIDGNRQVNKIFHHNATTLIDPELLKTVRISPGVAPADAGPRALGGSVAYETKDVDDLLPADKNAGGKLALEYASNGSVVTPSASLYGRSGQLEYLGFLKSTDGDLIEDGDGNEITGSKPALQSGLAKLAYQGDGGQRLELSFEQVVDDEARPYRADLGEIIGGRPVPETRTYDLERQNITLTYTDEEASGLWDPRVVVGYSESDLDLVEPDQLVLGKTDSSNLILENRFPLASGSITAGIDHYIEKADYFYEDLTGAFGTEAGTEESTMTGLYSQIRLNLTDRVQTSFGARFDVQEFEGTDGSTFDDEGFSANASAEFDATETTTLGVGASHVWGGIALAENFIINPAWAYPADGIEAVESDSFYVAASQQLGSWKLKAKVFETEFDNARTPSYNGGPELTTDLETSGYEVGIQYEWLNGFFRLGYADIESELDGNPADSFNGRYLTTPIGEAITLEIGQDLPERNLRLGLDAQIALEETDTFNADPSNPAPGSPLPDYEVVNVFVEYQPRTYRQWTVRGEVNNVFDETYANRATYGQEFVGEVDPLREPGRSAVLKVSYGF